MNLYIFFEGGYRFLRNRRYIPMRVMSPFRYLWRNIARFILPHWLEKTFCREYSEFASDFLKDNGFDNQLVVSFTSFPKRIGNVWQVVECLKRQTIRPDKIILYLSKEQFSSIEEIPDNLISRQDDIFHIEMVDGDLRSHKKFFYSFTSYPDNLVLLVDDDIYYPLNMVEQMLEAYMENSNSIICRFGYKIQYNMDGSIKNYFTWPLIQDASFSQSILFGTGGGSLFQPSKLYRDTCNANLFENLCPLADDIWINAMVRLSKQNIVKLDCGGLLPIYNKNNEMLCTLNVIENQNDVQLKAVDDYYTNHLGITIFKIDKYLKLANSPI